MEGGGDEDATSRCRVLGCNKDMRLERKYYQRHMICEEHLKSLTLEVDGEGMRFCQQSARLHAVADFEGEKRSCRVRLKHRNKRRALLKRQRKEEARRLVQGQADQPVYDQLGGQAHVEGEGGSGDGTTQTTQGEPSNGGGAAGPSRKRGPSDSDASRSPKANMLQGRRLDLDEQQLLRGGFGAGAAAAAAAPGGGGGGSLRVGGIMVHPLAPLGAVPRGLLLTPTGAAGSGGGGLAMAVSRSGQVLLGGSVVAVKQEPDLGSGSGRLWGGGEGGGGGGAALAASAGPYFAAHPPQSLAALRQTDLLGAAAAARERGGAADHGAGMSYGRSAAAALEPAQRQDRGGGGAEAWGGALPMAAPHPAGCACHQCAPGGGAAAAAAVRALGPLSACTLLRNNMTAPDRMLEIIRLELEAEGASGWMVNERKYAGGRAAAGAELSAAGATLLMPALHVAPLAMGLPRAAAAASPMEAQDVGRYYGLAWQRQNAPADTPSGGELAPPKDVPIKTERPPLRAEDQRWPAAHANAAAWPHEWNSPNTDYEQGQQQAALERWS